MSRFCWPEVQLTVGAKLLHLHDAVHQELVYMQQQRRTQPWMRSIVGLFLTKKNIGVLRTDALGIERCTFDRGCSRGVLDSVRICLGLVRSTSLQRGQHEAFQLFDTKTLALPHSKPKLKTQESRTAVSPDTFAAEDSPVEYTHRSVRFIRLRGDRIHYSPDGTRPDVMYYVHHLVHDDGSLAGRSPRVFCVSRETEKKNGVRQFVGPYALKMYTADHESESFKDDFICLARDAQVKNVPLPTWEWYYGDTLSMRGLPCAVSMKKAADTQGAAVLSNCEEVFAQSDLKRILVQCSGHDEFEQAFVDFTQGIASLAEKGIAHRDLSIGNVLLSKDTPCSAAFFAIATSTLCAPVKFTQRELEQRTGGLLHGVDMAGRVHPPPPRVDESELDIDAMLMLFNAPVQPEPQKGSRTGTLPFMAIGLLIDGPPHIVAYDLHSLMFVMVLFLYSYEEFSDVSFPERVPAKDRAWPQHVLEWTNRSVHYSPSGLGSVKRAFFAKPSVLMTRLKQAFQGDLWMQGDREYIKHFLALYLALWKQQEKTNAYQDRLYVTTEEVEAGLLKHRVRSGERHKGGQI
ncbi:hypothetical protein DFH06DRAFT_542690 [Mycena polygramma]|nr:hypothetical protein DFH06DRAFT_542690 [Mycena polygramma]